MTGDEPESGLHRCHGKNLINFLFSLFNVIQAEEKVVEKPTEAAPAPEQAPAQPLDTEEKKTEEVSEGPKDEPKEESTEQPAPKEEESTPTPEADAKETEEADAAKEDSEEPKEREIESAEDEDARIQSDFNCCGISLQA